MGFDQLLKLYNDAKKPLKISISITFGLIYMDQTGIFTNTFFQAIFVFMLILSNIGIGQAAEFQIEDIITAIKKGIQTVIMTRSGNPNFEIDNVKVGIAVVSNVTQIGHLVIDVAGFDQEALNKTSTAGAYH
jgi:hypothetical protein